ncbi:DUF6233 domain-containing protein [Streptomyces olivaceoviridis]
MRPARIDRKIVQLVQLVPQQAEPEHGRRARPTPPDWIVELGVGTDRPPVRAHPGTCYMAGKRHRPVSPEEARRLLTDGTSARSHCRPHTAPGIVGLD